MTEIRLMQNSSTPLYLQVKEIVVSRISNGKWQSGDLIPTEIELMKEFNVSRTTIRQAISILVQEGILEKRQGRGTTVKSLKLTGSLGRLTGFAEEILEKGYVPNSRLIKAEYRNDLFIEKKKLQVPDNGEIVLINRLRFLNDEPIAIEKTTWTKEIGEILMAHDLNEAKYYQLLEENNVFLKNAKETISAINATSYEAELLGVSTGTALLQMTRLSYGVDDMPLEFTITKFRSDLYQYKVDLHR